MGYEHRIYVLRIIGGKTLCEDNMFYGMKLASFDLGKIPEMYDILGECRKTDIYFYADDGNTKVLEDRYGKPLTEIPLQRTINILEKISNENVYELCKPVLEYLRTLSDSNCSDIVILHYGY